MMMPWEWHHDPSYEQVVAALRRGRSRRWGRRHLSESRVGWATQPPVTLTSHCWKGR